MDYAVHGILQARILERVAFPFSKGSSQHRDWTAVSCIPGGSLLTELTGKPPEMTGRAPKYFENHHSNSYKKNLQIR